MMDPCRSLKDPYGQWPPPSLDNDPLHRPPPPTDYGLRGPQVEPDASYWLLCPAPCAPPIWEVTRITDQPTIDGKPNPCYFPPYPGMATTKREIREVKELACLRDDPEALFSDERGQERLGLSAFLRLRPQPFGAVVNTLRRGDSMVVNGAPEPRRSAVDDCAQPRPDNGLVPCATGCVDDFFPNIRTGRELARYFESETPGLAHRLALNYLLRDANLSPPYQAMIWAALDVAIYASLSVAWYYKWIADAHCDLKPPCRPMSDYRRQGKTSRRPRPYEVDYGVDVLYNREVNCNASGDGERRIFPDPSPGTPRHPSYPSGHSTYSGAASEVLSYFFPDYAGEFTKLADNAGLARLWAGIHYRSDHLEGNKLGRCVGRIIIRQIERSCVVRPDPCDRNPAARCKDEPPTDVVLCGCAQKFCECCRRRRPDTEAAFVFGEPDEAEPGRPAGPETGEATSSADVREQGRGPQQGAGVAGSSREEREQAQSPQQGAPPAGSTQQEKEQGRGPQQGAK